MNSRTNRNFSSDLILLDNPRDSNGSGSPVEWPLGKIFRAENSLSSLAALVESLLKESHAEYFLFWDPSLALPEPAIAKELGQKPGDVWHSGLNMGMAGLPRVMDLVHPTWPLNRDPDGGLECTSWRLNLRACLIKTEVIQSLGFIRPEFTTLEGAGLELGYRYILNGAVLRHSPAFYPHKKHASGFSLPAADERLFAKQHFTPTWNKWLFFRNCLRPVVNRKAFFKAFRFPHEQQTFPRPTGAAHPKKREPLVRPLSPEVISGRTASVSILIPTLNRYSHLKVLLSQLRRLEPSPLEIIVVDQSQPPSLIPDFYDSFHDLPLQVIRRDQPGQCSSRNAGLQMAKGEYILFLDDDDEVEPDLIGKHLAHLRQTGADASCGVALEDGIQNLPENFRYPRVSDVFPTNNTFVKKKVFLSSGLFDAAYDRGARADADLGIRVYLAGCLVMLHPDISVIHRHAAKGGLRQHKARVVTYHQSRHSLLYVHLPSPTELYLFKRYFTGRQLREALWIAVFSTFQVKGAAHRKALKMILGFVRLPQTLGSLVNRMRKAKRLLERYPHISSLDQPS